MKIFSSQSPEYENHIHATPCLYNPFLSLYLLYKSPHIVVSHLSVDECLSEITAFGYYKQSCCRLACISLCRTIFSFLFDKDPELGWLYHTVGSRHLEISLYIWKYKSLIEILVLVYGLFDLLTGSVRKNSILMNSSLSYIYGLCLPNPHRFFNIFCFCPFAHVEARGQCQAN